MELWKCHSYGSNERDNVQRFECFVSQWSNRGRLCDVWHKSCVDGRRSCTAWGCAVIRFSSISGSVKQFFSVHQNVKHRFTLQITTPCALSIQHGLIIRSFGNLEQRCFGWMESRGVDSRNHAPPTRQERRATTTAPTLCSTLSVNWACNIGISTEPHPPHHPAMDVPIVKA